jgi:hypothetical protein
MYGGMLRASGGTESAIKLQLAPLQTKIKAKVPHNHNTTQKKNRKSDEGVGSSMPGQIKCWSSSGSWPSTHACERERGMCEGVFLKVSGEERRDRSAVVINRNEICQ